MARVNNTLWNRYKFKINSFVLVLSCYFLYQSLNPQFPDTWQAKQIGEFNITPMPYNLEAPYLHHGVYTKDFFLIFNKGQVKNIRQAYLNIGVQALTLEELQSDEHGILHGSQHGQEVHALSVKVLEPEHKLWLTIETWQGKQYITSWNLVPELIE